MPCPTSSNTSKRSSPGWRLALFLPVIMALLWGVMSGLGRLGIHMPASAVNLVAVHGALMTGGLFGTAISLERAVALDKTWPWLAPLFSGLATLMLIARLPLSFAQISLLSASCLLTLANLSIWFRQRVMHHAVLTLGAVCWLGGNLIWLMSHVLPYAVPCWSAFLVLTIAGERLELSRFVPTPPIAHKLFVLIVLCLLAGLIITTFDQLSASSIHFGLPAFAASLLALSIWLARYDIARRTLRLPGLTRYVALCLLSGYFWLAVSGVLGMLGAFSLGHPWRDAALHSLLLGFVMFMVLGHAPIILPAVAKLKLTFNGLFYVPLVLLHLSLLTRIVANLAMWHDLQRWGGMLNAVTLAVFALTVGHSIWFAQKPKTV